MDTATGTEVEELSREAGEEFLRARVSDRLGLTLDVFLAKVDAGEFDGTEDRDVLFLLTLVPFAR